MVKLFYNWNAFEMKSKKIEVMVVSPSNERPNINIFNKRNKLKQRNQF